MKLLNVALATFLVVGLAAPAIAAKEGEMTAGGTTIAGPGSTSIPAGESVTVLDGLNKEDVCVTVSNTGKDAVRLDLIEAAATEVPVPAGATVSHCAGVDSVNLVCVGTKTCTASWRADKL
jgi:hypothetical protein